MKIAQFLKSNRIKKISSKRMHSKSMLNKAAVQQETSSSWRFKGNEKTYASQVIDCGFATSLAHSMNLRFEERFRLKFKAKYAVSSNSGTSTLHQALLAFGVKPGDEVIIPALALSMCASVVIFCGAKPVFADIDPDTFLMDAKDVERKITPRTKAIMPVHLYGQVCQMRSIMKIAKRHDIHVLEDCAQCFLGRDEDANLGGTIGHVGSFSFQSCKHLASGDGGMLITNNLKIAERMRKFGGLGFKHLRAYRKHIKRNKDLFQDPSYLRHDTIAYNYRLSEIEAAVGLAQLERAESFVKLRQLMAKEYLKAIGKCDWLLPQVVPKKAVNSYWTFALRFEGENAKGISWHDFRKKYLEFGGDGFYSAWALLYNEPALQLLNKTGKLHPDLPAQAPGLKGFLPKNIACPIAESLQPKLMQFTTNQDSAAQRLLQANAMRRTLNYFGR